MSVYDYKYAIVAVYRIFDVLHFSKEKAYQIEDENGIHKDRVREGYTIIDTDEYDNLMKQGYTMDDDFFESFRDATIWLNDFTSEW